MKITEPLGIEKLVLLDVAGTLQERGGKFLMF